MDSGITIRFFRLFVLLTMVSGCDKEQIITLNLKGTIKGEVSVQDVFGWYTADFQGISVQLDNSNQIISTSVDETGHFVLEEIPSGTYERSAIKEGFGSGFYQNFQLVGGDQPIYLWFSLREIPEMTIEHISLEIIEGEVYLTGTVDHDYIIDPDVSPPRVPAFRYFVSKSEDPSWEDYLDTQIDLLKRISGWQIYSELYLGYHFSSGEKLFVIAYPCNNSDGSYYNFESKQYVYPTLGESSNVASIIIP